MLDVELFGNQPGLHHLVSALFHLVNALLLFFVLRAYTGDRWCSTLVALLFAVHPLNVESVAWASGRKDVLSAFFWLLTLAAYRRYVAQRSSATLALVLALFLVGLLAKPMLVTLPCVLLLLDYWPLGRLSTTPGCGGEPWPRLIREKMPLFLLAAGASYLAVIAQLHSENIPGLEVLPLGARLANAATAYGIYLLKTFLPTDLSVVYPHPGVALLPAVASLFVVVLVSTFAARARRTRPYLFVGWFWFLGTLVPVIGFVQLGSSAFADRYTYIPHIGLFIACAWLLRAAATARPRARLAIAAAAGAFALALIPISRAQVSHWRNTETLFEHAVQVSPNSSVAHFHLGIAYLQAGNLERAASQFFASTAIDSNLQPALQNLGASLINLRRFAEAEPVLVRLAGLAPENPVAHLGLAQIAYARGRCEDAVRYARAARRIHPEARVPQGIIRACAGTAAEEKKPASLADGRYSAADKHH